MTFFFSKRGLEYKAVFRLRQCLLGCEESEQQLLSSWKIAPSSDQIYYTHACLEIIELNLGAP